MKQNGQPGGYATRIKMDELPPVYVTLPVTASGGLGLAPSAAADYLGHLTQRLNAWALRMQVPASHVPGAIPFGFGRHNNPRTRTAVFDQWHQGPSGIRAAIDRFRRGRIFPLWVGMGFVPEHLHGDKIHDAADLIRDYADSGVVPWLDDAMGQGEIVAKLRPLVGTTMACETLILNGGPGNWSRSTDIDRPALEAAPGVAWTIRAGTLGRDVLLTHNVKAPENPQTPVYLLVQGNDNLTEQELMRFAALGFDRYVLQGIEAGDPAMKFGAARLRNWLES